MKLLLTSTDNVQSDLIVNMLKENGIPCFVKFGSGSGYFRILMGDALFERALYVGDEDYDRAKEIVDVYFGPESCGNTGEPEPGDAGTDAESDSAMDGGAPDGGALDEGQDEVPQQDGLIYRTGRGVIRAVIWILAAAIAVGLTMAVLPAVSAFFRKIF